MTTTAKATATGASHDPGSRLSKSQSATACGISVATIKRRLAEGAFPNATQHGMDQHWLIPVQDLIDAGLMPPDRVAAGLVAVEEAKESRQVADLSDSLKDLRAQLAVRDAELNGLRQQLDDAREQIAFLRTITAGRAA